MSPRAGVPRGASPSTAQTAEPRETAATIPESAALMERASGKRLTVPRGHATVGRVDRTTRQTPDVDLTSFENGRSAGRHHAVITFHDGQYFVLEETATSNGTFVNEVRVAAGIEVRLSDGDRVRFGLVDFTFRLE